MMLQSLKRYVNMDMVFLDEVRHLFLDCRRHVSTQIVYREVDTQGPVYKLEVNSKLPFLKDGQYSILNTLTIEPLDGQRCRQSLRGDVEIRVFGVGPVVQNIVLNSLKTAYKVLPEIVEKCAD